MRCDALKYCFLEYEFRRYIFFKILELSSYGYVMIKPSLNTSTIEGYRERHLIVRGNAIDDDLSLYLSTGGWSHY